MACAQPCERITKSRVHEGRVGFLSDDARTARLDACRKSTNNDLYSAVVLSLTTGAPTVPPSLTMSSTDASHRAR